MAHGLHKSGFIISAGNRVLVVFILIGLIWLIPNILHAQRQALVDRIEFEGNQSFSSGVLRERMTLKGYGWIQDVILGKNESVFDKELLSADLNHLTRFYQREGYLHASFSIDDLVFEKERRKVKILINVDEGLPVMVRRVYSKVLAENESDSLFADDLILSLLSHLHLVPGKRFRDKDAFDDISLISLRLADHGFPYAEVFPDLTVDTVANRVDVIWQIATGPQCYFGPVNITGNRWISAGFIGKHVAIKSGQTFKQSQLGATQRTLVHLGVFEIASVTAETIRDEADTIPVMVRVRELPWLSTKFGAGYGTEDKFRIFNESRLLGVLGGARRLTLFAKHSDLEPYHIRLQLTQPAFLIEHTHLTVGPFIRRHDEPGFVLTRFGIKTTVDHDFSERTSASVGHTFERIDLDTSEVAEISYNRDGLSELYNKSSALFDITYNGSEPPHSPSRGVFSTLAFKLSGLGLGSEYHFTRTLVDLRHYQKILGMVLATRVQLGGIESRDDGGFVPVEDRFFAGGSSSIRGWQRGELGPQDSKGIPAGGRSLLEASAEFRYPIIGILSGAVFTDAGNVWLDEFSYRVDDLRYSVGLGIRVATAIGPVRLDVARPVFDNDNAIQVHLSVGQAF